MEWDNAERARKFTEGTELRDVMVEAGVQGRPDISFLEEVQHTSA